MANYPSELAHILGENGVFAQKIGDFRFRPQQLAMAQALAASILAREPFLAEAGTGTGKTFAYLVPALLYGGKVLISTGTKTLQDQLFDRDLPLVCSILGLSLQLALLKGRTNYICLHRLERSEQELAWFSPVETDQIQTIRHFTNRSTTGDRGELAEIPEGVPIWPQVTSTKENCLGQECSFYRDCFLTKARKAALEADVVVVNHHLLFADLTLREEGFAELLPTSHTVICDEAHQLPDLASLFFGEMVSSGALNELARDIEAIALAKIPDYQPLREACAKLVTAVRHFRQLLIDELAGTFPSRPLDQDPRSAQVADYPIQANNDAQNNQRSSASGVYKKNHSENPQTGRIATTEVTLTQLRAKSKLNEAFPQLLAAIDALQTVLATQVERASELALPAKRLSHMITRVKRWWFDEETTVPEAPRTEEHEETESAATSWVRWLECGPHHFALQATPLETGPIFQRCLAEHPAAWIFTSATLSVHQDFKHFQAALGLHETSKGVWDSPFHYGEQAVLYLPKDLPDPRSDGHTEALLRAALPVLRASKGRAFFLFTTLKALDLARRYLPTLLQEVNLSFPILAQGDQPRSELLRQFRQHNHPILLGSQSFWEGIDVKGPQLSLVVIDKLPFRAPDNPIVAARVKHLTAQGRQPFHEYQLPEAIITLKQGVGRLIRSEYDRGVLLIGDNRLVEKSYGRQFIANLPPMARTRDLAAVENFFAVPSALSSAITPRDP